VTWQVLFFPLFLAGFPWPRSHNDLEFRIFGTFSIRSQKGIIVGGNPEAKHIEKTLLQKYDFSQKFFA
jgi:hypothetical protein